MKQFDITPQILALREEEELGQLMAEVDNELESNMPSLLNEVDLCLDKISEEEQSNVISFTPKKKVVSNLFAQTELLAASGQSLADWFSQPLNFGGAGFILDIRKVMGTDNEVDLYLLPNQSDESKMKATLSEYLGKSVTISVSNENNNLLTATLYVDESGLEAEGSGYIHNNEELVIKGKLNIEIVTDQ